LALHNDFTPAGYHNRVFEIAVKEKAKVIENMSKLLIRELTHGGVLEDGCFRIFRWLLKQNFDFSIRDNYAIRWATRCRYTKIVRMLLADKRVNPLAKDNYAITTTILRGFIDTLKVLLEDPRITSTSDLLPLAIQYEHNDIAKLLLKDKRTDPSFNYNEAIGHAFCKGNEELVRLLLADKRVDPNICGNWTYLSNNIDYMNVVRLLITDHRTEPELIRGLVEQGCKELIKILSEDPRFECYVKAHNSGTINTKVYSFGAGGVWRYQY
jgi:hypothetical protein